MNDDFEYYTLKLKTLAPVFVGSGKSISKKEYYYSPENDIIQFFDMNKLMEHMVRLDELDGKDRIFRFEEYMLSEANEQNESKDINLYRFTNDIGLSLQEVNNMTIYRVDNNDCFDSEHSLCEIKCFMRDSQNRAYIPGSTVKGMLRTILLQYLIRKKQNYKPRSYKIDKNGKQKRMKDIVFDEANNAEKDFFNTLKNNVKDGTNDAVNSIMQGIIISDSEFIDNSKFIVCQKKSYVKNQNKSNKINTARECLKAGVEVCFKIKIDNRFFKPKDVSISFEQLFKSMIEEFDSEYKDYYLSEFSHFNSYGSEFRQQFVILGGGSGFFGKNITYTMNGFNEGLRKTAAVMKNNKIDNKYVNEDDEELGISPHTLSTIKIGTNKYHMGLCSVSLEKDKI